jgi:DNA topoisomerase-2
MTSITSKPSKSSNDGNGAQYKKLSHREHILELPDTYVGSVETHEEWRWVLDSSAEAPSEAPASASGQRMTHKKVAFNPGFYKLFDELIVNARDALVRSTTTQTPIKHIDVRVLETETGALTISVENDGEGAFRDFARIE